MDSGSFINHFPFPEIRDSQAKILTTLANRWEQFQYFVIEAPTGVGKSAIAKAVAEANTSVYLLTASKQLQDQYAQTFTEPRVTILKGKTNYRCNIDKRRNVECGLCVGNFQQLRDCMSHDTCSYYNQRDLAAKANMAVMSYHYFLYSCMRSKFWRKRDVLIIDEAHLLENTLVQWATIQVNVDELRNKYGIKPRKHKPVEGYAGNEKWLRQIYTAISKKQATLCKQVELSLKRQEKMLSQTDLEEALALNGEYRNLDGMLERFNIFHLDPAKERWLITPNEQGLLLTPIDVGGIFQRYVTPFANKIVFMSATLLDLRNFASTLGLASDATSYLRVEPEFPPERSPILYIPTGSMAYSKLEQTIPKIVAIVAKILARHPNEKGIIHTGNYRLALALIEQLQDPRLLGKQAHETNEGLLKRHMYDTGPTVLVSPALTTGTDLYDDLSRFQVIVKMPWISLADPRVKLKADRDDGWYLAEMWRTFVQASGRSTRSAEDWSVTYVLDSKFRYWTSRASSYLPRQFLRRIEWQVDLDGSSKH